MTSAVAAAPPPAAPAANAAPAAATAAAAQAPFLLELGALASGEPMLAADPAAPEPAAADCDTETVSGLLNLILALAPPPAPAVAAAASAAPAATPDPALAALPGALAAPLAADAAAMPTAEVAFPPQLLSLPSSPSPLASAASPAPAPLTAASPWPPLALDQPEWCHELGERLLWTSDHGLSEATIDLHPGELGPIRVRIDTEGDTANVALQATHAATRELLAVSLPQLRELLNANGLQLGRSQVGSTAPGRESEARGEDATRGNLPVRRRWRVGLVDQYV